MVILGHISGRFLGWATIDCLFLGGILAISSTTIIIRTIHETGMKGRGFVEFVFGILIIEDLLAVLLLVLLSTIAVTNQFSGKELFYSTLKLSFFIILSFVFGIFIFPSFLKTIRRFLNEEMLLIVSMALCLFTVFLSTLAGFSPALGAFIMGSILAETSEVKKIEQLIRPLKDLFAAIFFVSVGMLINRKELIQYAGPILLLTLITIFGKFFAIMLGAIVSKRSIRHSVQAGLSLAQIGEFSFIIAALGINLKVTSSFLYPIAVGISVITTFTTPYLIRNIDPILIWIDKCLPISSHPIIKKNAPTEKNIAEKQKTWINYIYPSLRLIIINSLIISAIAYTFIKIFPINKRIIAFSLAIIFTSPFLWAIFLRKNNPASKTKKDHMIFLNFSLLRLLLTCSLIWYFANLSAITPLMISLSLLMILSILFLASPILKKLYEAFEKHFLKNLLENEIDTHSPIFDPWEVDISYLVIPAESEVAGKTLHELRIRETFGASIALIERGNLTITAPSRNEKLFPNDRVAIIGSEESVEKLTRFLKSTKAFTPSSKVENYALHKILVTETMSFALKTIRKSGIREKTDGLIIGIERHGEKILNPDSMLKIQPGDLLWIVGDVQKIKNIS
jgi:CPA2 family monovalent cation:H+ antiporter-2